MNPTAPALRTTALAIALAGALAGPAAADETVHTCTGFIDAVPAVIGTQGTWCLRRDLATAISGGAAIEIAANNVTLDCNGFKLGGLAAGDGSLASGVATTNRLNIVVRNCAIRGFHIGASMIGDGLRIEDSRFDQSLRNGILMLGTGNLVQRNQVLDTGGGTGQSGAFGISAQADIIDNLVQGVFPNSDTTSIAGIVVTGPGHVVRGNRVREVVASATGSYFYGLQNGGTYTRLEDNHVVSSSPGAGIGIGGYVAGATCIGNSSANFGTPFVNCTVGAHNFEH